MPLTPSRSFVRFANAKSRINHINLASNQKNILIDTSLWAHHLPRRGVIPTRPQDPILGWMGGVGRVMLMRWVSYSSESDRNQTVLHWLLCLCSMMCIWYIASARAVRYDKYGCAFPLRSVDTVWYSFSSNFSSMIRCMSMSCICCNFLGRSDLAGSIFGKTNSNFMVQLLNLAQTRPVNGTTSVLVNWLWLTSVYLFAEQRANQNV